MARKIEVVDYCPEWKEKFWQEAAKIQEILGENCITVYHIGSTSVKGLRAKPIIDLMPVVKELEAVDLHNKEFEALGYECKGEYGILGRRFFMKGGDLRTHHVHIFAEESRLRREINRNFINSNRKVKISSPHGKTCRKVKIFSFFYFREIGMMEENEVGQEKGGKKNGCYETCKQFTYVDRLWYSGRVRHDTGTSLCT